MHRSGQLQGNELRMEWWHMSAIEGVMLERRSTLLLFKIFDDAAFRCSGMHLSKA